MTNLASSANVQPSGAEVERKLSLLGKPAAIDLQLSVTSLQDRLATLLELVDQTVLSRQIEIRTSGTTSICLLVANRRILSIDSKSEEDLTEPDAVLSSLRGMLSNADTIAIQRDIGRHSAKTGVRASDLKAAAGIDTISAQGSPIDHVIATIQHSDCQWAEFDGFGKWIACNGDELKNQNFLKRASEFLKVIAPKISGPEGLPVCCTLFGQDHQNASIVAAWADERWLIVTGPTELGQEILEIWRKLGY